MTRLLQRIQQSAQNAQNLGIALLLNHVMYIVPGIRASLTHKPTLAQLHTDLDTAQEMSHRLITKPLQPLHILQPLAIRLEIPPEQLVATLRLSAHIQRLVTVVRASPRPLRLHQHPQIGCHVRNLGPLKQIDALIAHEHDQCLAEYEVRLGQISQQLDVIK